MSSFYYNSQRLGIYPEFNKLLISSKKSSSTIWLSENKNVMFVSLSEHCLMSYFKKFLKESLLYPLVSSTCLTLWWLAYAANLVRDCFPEPLTPSRRAFPLLRDKILWILRICSTASLKKTSYNFWSLAELWSSWSSSKSEVIFFS